MDTTQLTALFGWMTAINIGVYSFTAVFIIFARDWTAQLQARITGVPAEKWPDYYIDYLSRYKMMIIMFNLAPYLALRVVL